ncbi:hypothetical protein Drorol1_Dr00002028 [Drosera rotundifolia]
MNSRNDLFGDLPPPTHTSTPAQQPPQHHHNQHHPPAASKATEITDAKPPAIQAQPPPPRLKSALKRAKAPSESVPPESGSEKRLKFKTTTDASEVQVIDAMKKIASHIKNEAKMSKASKLAIQLIQAKSVKPENSAHFLAILEAAMSSPTSCHQASVRAHYHALFTAAQDTTESLNKQQKNQLAVWTIRAVVANDLFTDDSFVFSKTAGRVKELISALPVATKEDDAEEAKALKEESVKVDGDGHGNGNPSSAGSSVPTAKEEESDAKEEESDPFGLDALLSRPKKDIMTKLNSISADKTRKEDEEESKGFLRLQREALINCLEIAANRYRTPWCQTVIDILAKHAFDNISRFTALQRDAIEKLWASVREQHIRRKQGKSVSGKLDVNGFEWLQQQYASEKISIRRAVGGGGDRRCEQWLG